jgi:hypothetical protein
MKLKKIKNLIYDHISTVLSTYKHSQDIINTIYSETFNSTELVYDRHIRLKSILDTSDCIEHDIPLYFTKIASDYYKDINTESSDEIFVIIKSSLKTILEFDCIFNQNSHHTTISDETINNFTDIEYEIISKDLRKLFIDNNLNYDEYVYMWINIYKNFITIDPISWHSTMSGYKEFNKLNILRSFNLLLDRL